MKEQTKVIRNWGLRPINTRFYGKKTNEGAILISCKHLNKTRSIDRLGTHPKGGDSASVYK